MNIHANMPQYTKKVQLWRGVVVLGYRYDQYGNFRKYRESSNIKGENFQIKWEKKPIQKCIQWSMILFLYNVLTLCQWGIVPICVRSSSSNSSDCLSAEAEARKTQKCHITLENIAHWKDGTIPKCTWKQKNKLSANLWLFYGNPLCWLLSGSQRKLFTPRGYWVQWCYLFFNLDTVRHAERCHTCIPLQFLVQLCVVGAKHWILTGSKVVGECLFLLWVCGFCLGAALQHCAWETTFSHALRTLLKRLKVSVAWPQYLLPADISP